MSIQLILPQTKKTKIQKILRTLTSNIQHTENTLDNLGLYSGLAGELLFLWQACQYDNQLVDEQILNDKFMFLQENMSVASSSVQLSNGLSGLGWFIEYVNQSQYDDYDPELCEGIDEILLNTLGVKDWQGEIEMVLGLAGLSVYGARRQLTSEQTFFFDKFISHFEALATQTSENTLTWEQPVYSVYRLDKESRDKPEYNLGLAHGVPGIIASLLPALNIPPLYSRTKKLLIQSCDWLLEQELSVSDRKSYFSSLNTSTHPSRLGWCYGDLTIALILFRVGKILELPSYMEKAKEISLHAATRDEVSSAVGDAGLCHGSAGLALIFQLTAQELNMPELLDISEKWLDFTIELFDKNGIEGFYKLSGYDKTLSECTGFLEGYAGIGLCLISLLNGECDWADCLLLS